MLQYLVLSICAIQGSKKFQPWHYLVLIINSAHKISLVENVQVGFRSWYVTTRPHWVLEPRPLVPKNNCVLSFDQHATSLPLPRWLTEQADVFFGT